MWKFKYIVESGEFCFVFNVFEDGGLNPKITKNESQLIHLIWQNWYSRVHISSDEVFSKILKKPSIVRKNMIPHMKAFGLFNKMKQKIFWKKNIISMKTSSPFIWGIIYFCTMDGFFRILEKTSSELICTRLYQCTYVS